MAPINYFSKINYLMIEMNSQCNLKCIHCTREQLQKEGLRKPKNISDQELRFILDQLKDCPINTIKVEGLSEPMLNLEIADRISTVRNYFPNAHLILITNLQYNPENTQIFKALKMVDALYISIDGTEKIYETIRVNASYSRFINALDKLKEILTPDDLKKIHFNFTATEENYLELPKIYQLKDYYQLGSVRINLVQNWDENRKNSHLFSDKLIHFLKKYSLDIKGVANWNYEDCFWVYNGVVIDVDGNVRQCVLNTTQKPLGNAFELPLSDIYNNSARLNESRNCLSKNQPSDSCKTCDYKGLAPILAKIFSDVTYINKPRAIVK